MINQRAASDARHSRAGKDGAFYDGDGNLMATVESFSAISNWNNSKYSVLGDAQEHESPNTYSINLTMAQIVVEDDRFIKAIMDGMETGEAPVFNFQGSLIGRNGSDERVAYYECMPSGQIDLQNVTAGETVKRNWNFFVNRPPKQTSYLTVDRES